MLKPVCPAEINPDRRHKFWTTQPDCGSSVSLCGDSCAVAGLVLLPKGEGRTIATNDWVRSLVINKFMTNGTKEDNGCGIRPGQRGGHWSQAFRNDGRYNGSRIRQLPTEGKIQDLVSMVAGYAKYELESLIYWGVATSVDAKAAYVGGNRINVTAVVIGEINTTEVGLMATRMENAWAWEA